MTSGWYSSKVGRLDVAVGQGPQLLTSLSMCLLGPLIAKLFPEEASKEETSPRVQALIKTCIILTNVSLAETDH